MAAQSTFAAAAAPRRVMAKLRVPTRAAEPPRQPQVTAEPAHTEILPAVEVTAEPMMQLPEPVWNLLTLLEREAPVELTPPVEPWRPARRRRRLRPLAYPGLTVAAVAWLATAGVIGAAAFEVIHANPPQGASSIHRVSPPRYSYYAPGPQP
jgi:hypothetical protein